MAGGFNTVIRWFKHLNNPAVTWLFGCLGVNEWTEADPLTWQATRDKDSGALVRLTIGEGANNPVTEIAKPLNNAFNGITIAGTILLAWAAQIISVLGLLAVEAGVSTARDLSVWFLAAWHCLFFFLICVAV
ncbi:MAG: hypothetical protein AAF556_07610 [Pseudomonadota bacterium]